MSSSQEIVIRTFELEDNYLDEDDPWKGILSGMAFTVRSTFHAHHPATDSWTVGVWKRYDIQYKAQS